MSKTKDLSTSQMMDSAFSAAEPSISAAAESAESAEYAEKVEESNLSVQSFTSASTDLPVKILQDMDLLHSILARGQISPRHIQLIITNKCNLAQSKAHKCQWCSCDREDRSKALTYAAIEALLTEAKQLGCQAITITGGGEPLMHPDFAKIIDLAYSLGIKIGLVTNGWLLYRYPPELFDKITWARISLGDGRIIELKPIYWEKLASVISKTAQIDWSFSYVWVGHDLLPPLLLQAIEFANRHGFTHIRLVEEIVSAGDQTARPISSLRESVHAQVDDHLVIYQGRSKPTAGNPKCLISLLKPVISATGEIFPCCGVQYALDPPSLCMDKRMKMGEIKDFANIIANQAYFRGDICHKCYYEGYNRLLGQLSSPLKHREFV